MRTEQWKKRQGAGGKKLIYLLSPRGIVQGITNGRGITFEKGDLTITSGGVVTARYSNVAALQVQ